MSEQPIDIQLGKDQMRREIARLTAALAAAEAAHLHANRAEQTCRREFTQYADTNLKLVSGYRGEVAGLKDEVERLKARVGELQGGSPRLLELEAAAKAVVRKGRWRPEGADNFNYESSVAGVCGTDWNALVRAVHPDPFAAAPHCAGCGCGYAQEHLLTCPFGDAALAAAKRGASNGAKFGSPSPNDVAAREAALPPELDPIEAQEHDRQMRKFGHETVQESGRTDWGGPPPDAILPAVQVTREMVDRFLTWPLPDSVCADLCATKQAVPHRTGTNLLTFTEAKQMLEHVLAAGPSSARVAEGSA